MTAPGTVGQADADLIGRHVEDLLLRHARAAETVLQDRDGGSVVLNDERGRGARRQLLSTVWAMPVICATAGRRKAFALKKTLMTPIPL